MFDENCPPIIIMPQSDGSKVLLSMCKLGKDDTFAFGCNKCGDCCRERGDTLLSPIDLYRIAGHLNKSVADVIREYCEFYEGSISKVPVVRIKPRRQTCPFLDKRRCTIQAVKPAVCALYPLGQMTHNGEITYFLLPVPCGNKKQTQTVREWINGFSVLDDEEYIVLWHKNVDMVSEIIKKLYDKADFDRDRITQMLFLLWYVRYDLDKDFMPQFTENCEMALKLVKVLMEKAENAV